MASCSALDWPLLEAIAAAGKPVICSTGGKTIHDIDKIVSFFDHRYVKDLALLHCVGLYPTPERAGADALHAAAAAALPPPLVGYSGHEAPDNLDVVKAAVALGARILERHVGLAREGDAARTPTPSDPAQTGAWVEAALRHARDLRRRRARRRIPPEEIRSLHQLTRGAFARRAVKAGRAADPRRRVLRHALRRGPDDQRRVRRTA